ncbi:MAG: methyl-accepting chemotaxis protein [Bdellovibrionales bacterium]|nr:methyl-accepting chemotaxis protein [Bdellovibrionales bacterium]
MWKRFNEKYLKTKRTKIWIDSDSQKRFILDLVKHYFLMLVLVFFFVYSYPFVAWFTLSSPLEHRAVLEDFVRINVSKWPLFLAVLFIFCFYAIMISHKIFGPLVKLKNHFQLLKEGTTSRPLRFREGDYLMHLADPVNEYQQNLQQKITEIEQQLKKIPRTPDTETQLIAIENILTTIASRDQPQ